MWGEFSKILVLLVVSGTKFLMGPGTILASGYSASEAIIINIIGGILGSLFFFYFGAWFFNLIERRFRKKRKRQTKKFTWKNRLIIRFKNRFGVVGMALLIPIISIPVSALISAKYFRNDRKSIPAYIMSVVFWSFVLTYFSNPVINSIKELF
jgi:H+/gluconate symporter-like permease